MSRKFPLSSKSQGLICLLGRSQYDIGHQGALNPALMSMQSMLSNVQFMLMLNPGVALGPIRFPTVMTSFFAR